MRTRFTALVGTVGRGVRRLSVKTFTDCIHVIPLRACDREPEGWGYPGCAWVSIGWLRWSLQVSLYTGYTPNAPGAETVVEHQPRGAVARRLKGLIMQEV